MARASVRTCQMMLVFVLVGLLVSCGSNTTPLTRSEVTPGVVSVSVSPGVAAISTGQSQSLQFSAAVAGTTNTGVTWAVNGVAGGNATVGTITSSGLYASPSAPTSAVVTVTATSAADATKSASSNVILVPVGQVTGTQNPQVAQYSFTSPTDATVTIQFGPDTTYGLQTWSQPVPAGGGTLKMLVAGMRANSTYHMRASVRFSNGVQYFDSDRTFTTGGLTPDRIPQIEVTTPTSGLSPAGGIELLALNFTSAPQIIRAAAIDLQGNIVWYYDFLTGGGVLFPFPIKPLPDGNMLVILGNAIAIPASDQNVLQEIDLAGNVVRQLSLTQLNQALASAGFNLVGIEMHHDVAVLPNGHWVVIVATNNDSGVRGDALVDLDPTFKPVWVWNAFDHLDLSRQPLSFPDWTHSNAVVYSPDDGNLLLSMRNQSWVVKIDYEDGKGNGNVLWRLGAQGDFTLTGGEAADWFYNQHFPIFLSPNSTGSFQLGIFDNGNQRPDPTNGYPCQTASSTPGGGACYSRAPILQVNEVNKTAAVVWEDKISGFGVCCGNMQLLPNGDAEYDLATSTQAPPFDAQILEVTHETMPQTVWKMELPGSLAYRAFRIPSLYPGVQW